MASELPLIESRRFHVKRLLHIGLMARSHCTGPGPGPEQGPGPGTMG